ADTAPSLYHEQPGEMAETIVEGTRRVRDFAGTAPILLISSGAVSGPQTEDRVDESSECDPTTLYGLCKHMAELLGGNVKIARCFTFAGPYLPLDTHYAFGNFVRDALRGGPIRVASDGTSVRSYLYAADLVEWLWTILLRGRPGRPYNVGSE